MRRNQAMESQAKQAAARFMHTIAIVTTHSSLTAIIAAVAALPMCVYLKRSCQLMSIDASFGCRLQHRRTCLGEWDEVEWGEGEAREVGRRGTSRLRSTSRSSGAENGVEYRHTGIWPMAHDLQLMARSASLHAHPSRNYYASTSTWTYCIAFQLGPIHP